MATIGELTVDMEIETRALRNAAKDVAEFANNVNKNFRQASESVTKFGANTKKVLNDTANTLNSIGTNLSLKLTLPILGAGVVAAKFGGDFEQAFTGVIKVVDGTAEEIARLRQDIVRLATVTPTATNELLGIAEAAGILGIKIQDIANFTDVIAQLGAATSLTTEDAAVSLARLANITGESIDNIDRLGSALVTLGNNLAANESEIVATANRLSTLATTAGLTAAEIFGLAAAAPAVGLNPEEVGSAFQRIFDRLQKIVREGGKELAIVAAASGSSINEFTESFRANNLQGLIKFSRGLNLASAAGVELGQVFDAVGLGGVRNVRTLSLLTGNIDEFTRAIDLSNKGYDENIALAEEAALFYGTFNNQVKALLNPIKQLVVNIGGSLLPIFKEWITGFREGILPSLQNAVKFITQLSDSTKAFVVVFAGLLATLGPLAITISVLLKVLVLLAGGTSGFGLIIGVVAAASAALALLIANWDEVIYAARRLGNFLTDLWYQVGDDINRAVTAIKDTFEDLFKFYIDFWEGAYNLAKDGIDKILGFLGGGEAVTIPGLGETAEEIKRKSDALDVYNDNVVTIKKNLADVARIDPLAEFAGGIGASLASDLNTQGQFLGEEFGTGVKTGLDKIAGPEGLLQELFFGANYDATGLQDLLTSASSAFVQDVTSGFEGGLNDAVKNVFEGNKSILDIFRRASEGFTDGLEDGIANALSTKAGNAFSQGFSKSVENLQKTFAPQLESLGKTFSGFVDQLPKQAGTIASGGLAVASGVQQGGVGGFISGAAGGAAIGAAFGGPVGALAGGIIGGIASLFGGGKKERIRIQAEAFTVGEALTNDFVEGVGLGFLNASEKGVASLNALDAEALTGFAINDYLKGIRTSLEGLPGAVRDYAITAFDGFKFDAQTLFGESGDDTSREFKSFLEGALGGRLTEQLEPVFTGIFQRLGASAERAEEYFNARFAAISSGHSEELVSQLQSRFRRDFQALVQVANIVEGNTGLVGAIDRARFLVQDLGVELKGALTLDSAIQRARELVANLEIDESTANKIREVTQLLVQIPLRLAASIRSTTSRIRSLGESLGSDFFGRVESALRSTIESLNGVLQNTTLSIEDRGRALNEQHAAIQQLVSFERNAFQERQRAELDSLQTQLHAINTLKTDFSGVFDAAGEALLRLQTSSDNTGISGGEQFNIIQSEIRNLQGRALNAEGAELRNIQSRLTQLFPESIRVARQANLPLEAAFRDAQDGLKLIQEQTLGEITEQEKYAVQQNEILARMEQVENRQFEVSTQTRDLLSNNLAGQQDVLERQLEKQEEMVAGLEKLDVSINNVEAAIEQSSQIDQSILTQVQENSRTTKEALRDTKRNNRNPFSPFPNR